MVVYFIQLTWLHVSTEILKIGDAKKVQMIQMLQHEQMLIAIAGNKRHVRMYPLTDSINDESIKIEESKGCTTLTCGMVRQQTTTCVCIAVKK